MAAAAATTSTVPSGPEKSIAYKVAYVSSESEYNFADELTVANMRLDFNNLVTETEVGLESSDVSGWISGQRPVVPVELGLYIGTAGVFVQKLIFLIHEKYVPSSVEIYLGTWSPGKKHSTYDLLNGGRQVLEDMYFSAKFRRIGFVSCHEKSVENLTCRERLAVPINQHVSDNGSRNHCFCKLLFHRPFIRNKNIYNQVGLRALQILGTIGADSRYGDLRPYAAKRIGSLKMPTLIHGSKSVDDILGSGRKC